MLLSSDLPESTRISLLNKIPVTELSHSLRTLLAVSQQGFHHDLLPGFVAQRKSPPSLKGFHALVSKIVEVWIDLL